MEIIISGRHLDVTNELREHAENLFQKLAVEYPKLTTASLVLDMQRNWHIAEAHLHGKHLNMDASARTDDMYVSIDEVFGKLEKQLRKYLDRIQDHRVKGLDGELAEAEEAEEDEEMEEDVVEEESENIVQESAL